MRLNLGNVELGDHENTNRWVSNLKRYPSVRFFGVSFGRFFLGLIFGSKGKSRLELTQNELIRVEDELAAAKQENAELASKIGMPTG